MGRIRGRATVAAVVAPMLLALGACGSGGSQSGGAPLAGTAANDAAAAPVSLPCQPDSGRRMTSGGPMNGTDLSGQQLACAVFAGLTMNQVSLRGSQLPGATFRSSTLNRVSFAAANLIGADFDGSTLNFPDFSDADLRGAKLTTARLNSPVWTGATCPDGTRADESGCAAAHLNPLPVDAGTTDTAPPPSTQPPTSTAEPAPTTTSATGAADVPQAPAVFNTTAHGTYRCGAGTISINGAGSDLHLIGRCDLVVVNGARSQVEIDSANRIVVNGAKAEVTYRGTPTVVVNGAGANARPA